MNRILVVLILGLLKLNCVAWLNAGESIEGAYLCEGIVDTEVESQYKGTGIVMIDPVTIAELLHRADLRKESCPFFELVKTDDSFELLSAQGKRMFWLSEIGEVTSNDEGQLLIHGSVKLTAEGTFSKAAQKTHRLYAESVDDVRWLVLDTLITWRERKWFRKKEMSYRSIVRFREMTSVDD